MKNLRFLFLILFSNSFLFSMENECNNIVTPKNQKWRVDREIQCEELPTYNLTEKGKPAGLLKDRLRVINFNKQGTEIIALNRCYPPLCFVWDRYSGKLLERIENATASNSEFNKPIWTDRLAQSHSPDDWPEGWYWKDYDLEDELEPLMLAIKQAENKVCVWDKTENKESLQFVHNDRVNTALFNRKGIEIVTTSEDHTMRLWHSKTGEELFSIIYDSSATAADFNQIGAELVVATEDGKIQILVKEISQ